MKKALLTAAVIIIPFILFGAVQEGAGVIFPELEIGAGARASAMADAYTAAADDSGSAYWNAAGLGRVKIAQAAFSYDKWFMDTFYQRLMGAVPAGPGAIGADISYMNYGSFKRVDTAGNIYGKDMSPYYLGAILAYGFQVSKGFYLGAGAKFLTNSLDDTSNTGFAADIGAQYASEILSIGLAAQNIGAAGDYSLPLIIRAGAAARILNSAEHALMLSGEGKYTLKGVPCISAGAEYIFSQMLAVRAGYKFTLGPDVLSGLKGFSAGAGIKLGVFGIDYAFIPYGDLGASHKVSAVYTFGEAAPKISKAGLDELMAAAGKVEDSGNLNEAQGKYNEIIKMDSAYAPAYKRLGSVYFKQGMKQKAVKTFEQYLKMVPSDSAVKKWMDNNNKTAAELDTLMLKAGAVEDAGQLKQAEVQYLVIKGYDENYAPVYKRLGAVYFKLGRKAEAIKTFEKYLQLKPDDTAVQNWMKKNNTGR